MSIVIIDTPDDVTAKLPALVHDGVRVVFGYLSSINPHGGKCLTPARARAIAAAGLKLGLVHEGFGGVGGKGISAADGARDGAYCRAAAQLLGAPKHAAVYFACDQDFSPEEIAALVLPYFRAVRLAFADGFYRVGVYGSGAVCEAVIGAGLADLSWEAQSKGWARYSDWLARAELAQGATARLDGLDVDTDRARDGADIGVFTPFANAAPIEARPAGPVPAGSAPAAPGKSGWLAAVIAYLKGDKA